MLSLAHVSGAHGAHYYKVENYYSQKDSLGYSRWVGKEAARYGLEGMVDHQRFSQLLQGEDRGIFPAGRASHRKRSGLDMTFSAPKSVSLQALVFGDLRLVEAHREAVLEALSYAEKHFAVYRAGGKKDRLVKAGKGFIVAQFEHDSSRLKDPQLHTHNVVLNRMENESGQVRALHGDLIFKNSVLLGLIYQNGLAQKTQALGYPIQANARGGFEILGYSKEQLGVFSKRKKQIQALNPQNYRETRKLVLQNRRAKEGPQQREQLWEKWEKEAITHGIFGVVPRPIQEPSLAKRSKSTLQNSAEKSAEGVLKNSLDSITTRSSVFKKEEVLKESLLLSLGQFSLSSLENAFEKAKEKMVLPTQKTSIFTTKESVQRDLQIRDFVEEGIGTQTPLSQEDLVKHRIQSLQKLDVNLAKETLLKAKELLTHYGIPDSKIKGIFKPFEESMEKEKRVSFLDFMALRKSLERDIDAQRIEKVLAPLPKVFLAPTQGQQNAIEKTLLSKDQFLIWQGVAGAGKTYALKQIVEEAKLQGREVKGLAPSSSAALLLAQETGVEAQTLQGHLLQDSRSSAAKRLWIVDEAGMIGARDFKALLVKAKTHQAQVVLVGDHRQLSPIEAGNPFLDIQRNTRTTLLFLKESLRQKDPLLQVAVAHFNRGDMAKGIGVLESQIQILPTLSQRQSFLAKEYLGQDPKEQSNTLLLARTHRMREDLTTEIRNGLKEKGLLSNERLVPVFKKWDFSPQRLAVASTYTPGDVVIPHRSYPKEGIYKDVAYEVIGTNTPKNTVLVRAGGSAKEIPLLRCTSLGLYYVQQILVAEGDKMIWNRNTKSLGQLNNAGFVVEKMEKEGIHVRTSTGKTHVIDPKSPQHMEHAWAITVYKAQGQTASHVLQMVDPGTTQRDLLVGVTRAVHQVGLVGETKDAVLKSALWESSNPIAAEEVLLIQVDGSKNRLSQRGLGPR